MEKLLATGKVKAIGVSNYSKRYLEELLRHASVVPAVNQIENHPSLPQQEIVDFCKEKGIHVTAYSPLGSTGSPLFSAEPIVEVAKKKGVTPATILLSWHSKFLLFWHLVGVYICLTGHVLITIFCSCSRLLCFGQICHAFSYRGQPQPGGAGRFRHGYYCQIYG